MNSAQMQSACKIIRSLDSSYRWKPLRFGHYNRALDRISPKCSCVTLYLLKKQDAAHAIRLAKLDPVYRALRLDPRFEDADSEDVEDLLAMLNIIPFDSLLHKDSLLLNPTFGESSQIVGGADADLIAGNLLVDFKVTKKGEMSVRDLDQLLGYYFLARRQRHLDPKFPEIKGVALYFCRHGHLWPLDVATWIDQPEFLDIEKWFFSHAKEVFER